MVGGPFFEEVWYAPEGPFPPGARVLHIEESTERLARNHGLDAGLIAGLRPALEALCAQVEADGSDAFTAAAAERNRRFAALHDEEQADRRARLDAMRERRPMPVPIMLEALAAAVPEDVVIVEEAITGSPEIPKAFSFAGHGDYFCGRGGGIGQGIAGALGVNLAIAGAPDGLPLGRWVCDVQHPGALDRGAPPAAHRLCHPRQRRVPHPQAQPRHLPEALRRRDEPPLRTDGPGRSASGLRRDGGRHGRRRVPASPNPTSWPRR